MPAFSWRALKTNNFFPVIGVRLDKDQDDIGGKKEQECCKRKQMKSSKTHVDYLDYFMIGSKFGKNYLQSILNGCPINPIIYRPYIRPQPESHKREEYLNNISICSLVFSCSQNETRYVPCHCVWVLPEYISVIIIVVEYIENCGGIY